MSETDAFALAYGRLSATTVRLGARSPDQTPAPRADEDRRPSRLLPRLALLRPPVRRDTIRQSDRPHGGVEANEVNRSEVTRS